MILSIKKAMDIIDCIALKGRMSNKELSAELDLPKSTVSRLLQTLEATGYVEQDPVIGDYLLSYKFYKVGYEMLEKSGIRSCVLPVIKQLAESANETVNFTVLDDAKVLYLEKIEASPIHGGIRVGVRAPLHCTSSGKVMLANLPPESLQAVLTKIQPMEAYTDKTIVTVEELLQQLEDVRKKGYAVSRDELGNGVNAIAAFVSDYPGREAAAVSIAGPQNRFSNDRFIELSELVISAANEISRRFRA